MVWLDDESGGRQSLHTSSDPVYALGVSAMGEVGGRLGRAGETEGWGEGGGVMEGGRLTEK